MRSVAGVPARRLAGGCAIFRQQTASCAGRGGAAHVLLGPALVADFHRIINVALVVGYSGYTRTREAVFNKYNGENRCIGKDGQE